MHRMVLAVATVIALVAPTLMPPPAAAETRFSDDDQTVHSDAIEALAQVGVVGGYPDGTYRPRQSVSRDQMATFLMRSLRLGERSHSFEDVDPASTHSGAVGAIARERITLGCASRLYCPRDEVTRAQMATFLQRALDLPDDPSQSFRDVDPDDVHAPGIRAVAAAGITLGCGDGTRYCPTNPVQRDQMAAFLDRALGLNGPVPCQDVSPTASANTIGNAVYGFGVSTGVRTGDRLELLSMDLEDSRAARVRTDEGTTAIQGTATVPSGTRTWASAAGNGHVFIGQDTGGANLYRIPSTDADDRPVSEVAQVPYGGEFWALTLDEEADRLWAGTRGHREEDLADDEHVLYRIDDASTSPSEPHAVTFSHETLPRDGDVRPDVKVLHWDTDEQTLFVGLGGSATFAGAARLYALRFGEDEHDTTPADDPEPSVEDLTPPDIAAAELEIFSLAVSDTHLAIGTRSEARAHVALRERGADEWHVDRLPEGHRRVDRVALDEQRLVATSFPSGTVFEYDLADGQRTDLGSAPGAGDQPTRFLEIDGDTVRGVTGQGTLWTRQAGDWRSVPFTNRSGAGALTAPGLAHSLALTSRHVVAGANNSVHARRLSSPADRTVTAIGGEVKALATYGSTAWAATYPGATLWRVEPGEGVATRVGTWDGRYQRPRDATYSAHRNRVLVVARTDPAHTSGLFVLDPDGRNDPAAVRVTDGAPGLPSWQQRNVQSTAVATLGNYAFVGTFGAGVQGESGGVVAYDLRTMRKVWYARPALGGVVSLEMVDNRLVGVAQPNSAGRGNTWFELNPGSGRLLAAGNDDTRLGRGPIGAAVSLGPVTIGAMGRDVVAVQRGADRATGLYRHRAHQTFGGPFIDADRRGGWCTLYAIEDRQIFRLSYDPATRLDN